MNSKDFFEAIIEGDLKKIQRIVQGGFNPNSINYGDKSPLQIAIDHRQNEIIKYLLHLKKRLSNSKDFGPAIPKEITGSNNYIAIVGIGCRFPGGADTPKKFWTIFEKNIDVTSEIPITRWNNDIYFNPDKNSPGKIYTKYGSFIEQPIDQFDPSFFKINPREAKMMDPKQRLLLEVTCEAFENAGIATDQLLDSQTGVFIGTMTNDYYQLIYENNTISNQYVATGNVESVLSGRISYYFGFNGPSLTINTACSSSLVSLHIACNSLLANECNLAVAGGVNMILSPDMMINACQSNLLSTDGHCKSFDEKADGYVRGEGCGIVILKRLSEALNERNTIYTIVRGSAINQDGASTGLTVPSKRAQENLIKKALKNANLKSFDIDYIEAHGTGTSLGDPIEANAISNVFENDRISELKVSTAKSNIGHLEAAAGIAGLIKASLALKNNLITGNIHLKNLNKNIIIDEKKINILRKNIEWPKTNRKRRAGISSFGFSGTNAHVIIEEAPEIELDVENILKNQWLKMSKQYNHLFDDVECTKFKEYKKTSHLIVLSARNEKALIDLQKKYIEYLKESREDKEENNFEQDMCFTASVGRNHFSEERIAFLFNNLNELENNFDFNLKENNTIDSNNRINGIVKRSTKKNKNSSKVAFLFTGQGSQYARMSYDLFESNLVFRTLIINCDRILSKYLNSPKLVDVLYGCSNEYLNDTEYAQVTLFSLEYCLACLWRSFGIECDIVMGHSIGEYVASVLSGCISLEDGIKLTYMRGKLMKQTQNGKMIAVLFDLSKIEKLIQQNGNKIDVAGINSQKQIVLSGAQRDIDQFAKLLLENGCTSVRELNTNKAFHSRYMEPILDEFDQYAKTIQFKSDSYKNNRIIWISTLDGLKEKNSNFTLTSKHWTNQIRNKVDFMASVKILIEMNVTCCIEIGPNQILTKLAQQCLNEYLLDNNKDNILWLNTLKPKTNDMFELQFNLAKWYVNGGQVDWMGFHSSYISKRIVIPTYAFQRQSYWIDKKELTKYGENKILSENNQPLDIHLTQSLKNETYSNHPLLGNFLCVSSSHNEYVFEHTINTNSKQHSYLLDHKIFDKSIYPGACYIEMIYSAAFYIGKMLFNFDDQLDISIEEINFQSALYLMPNQSFILQTIIVPKSNNENNFDFFIYSKKMAVTNFKPNDSIMHSKGNLCISMRNKKDKSFNINLQSIRNRCNQSLDSDQVYESIRNNGINYGPLFRPIKSFFFDKNEAHAVLDSSFFLDGLQYSINPIMLDGCLQVLASLFINTFHYSDVYIPYSIKSVHILKKYIKDDLKVVCYIKNKQELEFKGDILVFDLNEDLLISINDLTVKKFKYNQFENFNRFSNYFYKDTWKFYKSYSNSVSNFNLVQSIYSLLEPFDVHYKNILSASSNKIFLIREMLDKISLFYINKSLNEIRDKSYRDIVLPKYSKLLNKLFLISSKNTNPTKQISESEILKEIEQKNLRNFPEIQTLIRCGSQLTDVLIGQKDSLSLLFPKNESELGAKDIYRESIYSSCANKMIAFIIFEIFSLKSDTNVIRILEIGAGTGATTHQVLSILDKFDLGIEYTFTDISPSFFSEIKKELSKYKTKLEFKTLDIEKDPSLQNFQNSKFHIIIATNVLHATKNLNSTLINVQSLIANSGILIISETVDDMMWLDLTFGLLDGWWIFDDKRENAIIDCQKWKQILEKNNFKLNWSYGDQQAVILSYYETDSTKREDSVDWIVFSDVEYQYDIFNQNEQVINVIRGDFNEKLSQREYKLSNDHENLKSFFENINISNLKGIFWFLRKNLKNMNDAADYLKNNCTSLMSLYQILRSYKLETCKLLIVTHGAVFDAIHPEQTALWALGKTIQNEDPNLNCILVDFDPNELSYSILKTVSNEERIIENRIAIRKQNLYASRLEEEKLEIEKFEFDQSEKDGTFLITGSSGGLGQALVEWLVAKGINHLALISRSELDHNQAQRINELNKNKQCDIKRYQCDVSDRNKMSHVFKNIEKNQKKIIGIFHLSGLLDDATIDNQNWTKFENVFKAKIYGSINLHELSVASNIKYFVIFSSIASFFASIGQANHVCANSFCDSLIKYRRNMGLAGQTINWGYWSKIGIAAGIGADRYGKMRGMDSISKEDGFIILESILSSNMDQIGVCPIDWKLYFKKEESENLWLENFFHYKTKTNSSKVYFDSKYLSNMSILQNSDFKSQKLIIKEAINNEIKSLLLLPDNYEIDEYTGFLDLGMDSLVVTKLRNNIQLYFEKMNYDIKLSPNLIFEKSNVNSLVEYLGNLVSKSTEGTKNYLVDNNFSEKSIAIIGMSCLFPGGADTPEEFWKVLINGENTVCQIPKQRWNLDEYFDMNVNASGKIYTKLGAFLKKDISLFDAEFFKINNEEACFMDPQQRILLEITWEALERSGITIEEIKNKKTSVFLGIGSNEYSNLLIKHQEFENVSKYQATGNNSSATAGRLSYFLGITGPNVSINTACSSSLVAVHLACQSILNGESNICIVAGVNLIFSPELMVQYCSMKMLAQDGICRVFDNSAAGFVRGEGCGVIVLKSLKEAIEERNNIECIINSSAVNQDGASASLMAPNSLSQIDLMNDTLKKAELNSEQIDYIEAHGTGTALGDPVEIEAISKVHGQKRDKPLIVTSVKSNIGHLEAAAGIAGLIKASLALKNNLITGNIHLKNLNKNIIIDEKKINILRKNIEWPKTNRKRRAGISSFGFSGTNAHVIIEEAPEIELDVENILKNQWLKMSKQYNHLFDDVECTKFKEYKKTSHLIVLSARNEKALIDLQKKYIEYLKESREENNFEQDMCFTASVGRNHFSEERIAFLFNNLNELENDFDFNLKENNTIDSNNRINGIVKRSTKKNKNSSKVAFLFTGQGSQYARMSYDLFESNLVFRTLIINCDRILSKYLNSPKLVDVLYGCSNEYLNDTEYAQVTLFSLEYCLACLWRSFGIECDIVMGHSIGEYVASVLSGCISLEDGIKLTYMRGKLMKQTQNGKMIAVLFDLSKIEKLIQQNGNKIDVAGINSQKQIVLSGAQRDIDQFAKLLLENGCTSVRELNTNKAFHSRYMEPILDEFDQYAKTIQFKSDSYKNNSIIWISTLDGLKEKNSNFTLTSKHWTNQIRNKVDFMASVKILIEMNVTCCIEIGPNQILTKLAQQCLNEYQLDNNKDNILWLNTLKPKTNDLFELQFNLAKWYVNGGQVDWMSFHSSYISKRMVIPTYAFQRQSYWPLFLNNSDKNTPSISAIQNKEPNFNIDGNLFSLVLHDLLGRNNIDWNLSFFENGGNSLNVTILQSRIRQQFCIFLSLLDLQSLSLQEISNKFKQVEVERFSVQLVNEPEKYLPFPLTDIQYSYWIGRQNIFGLGNVSAHGYLEVDTSNLDVEKFENSLNYLIQRHDMLRVKILPDGLQQILKQVDKYSIKIYNLKTEDYNKINQHLQSIRNELSHQVIEAARWPLFDIRISVANSFYRIHLSFDSLIFDMFSLKIFLDEWYYLYNEPIMELDPLKITFKDYVLWYNSVRKSERYIQDKSYWIKKLPSMPSAPNIPLEKRPEELKNQTFIRCNRIINYKKWSKVKSIAKNFKISPTSVLLAFFSAVLSRYSESSEFLINLTLFRREEIHEDIQKILGDFTVLEIFAVDFEILSNLNNNFLEGLKLLHKRLWEDLDHSFFNGIEVQREILNLYKQNKIQSIAPVVFTSLLNYTDKSKDNDINASSIWQKFGNVAFSITQTPQIWIDHKTFEANGNLVVEWDYVDGLFEKNMVENMHSAYCDLIEKYTQIDWNLPLSEILTKKQIDQLLSFNNTSTFTNSLTLIELIERQFNESKSLIAVSFENQNLTYEELDQLSNQIGFLLKKVVTKKNELIGILMDRSIELVATLVGVLKIGCAFLPLDTEAPLNRLNLILDDSRVNIVIKQTNLRSDFKFNGFLIEFSGNLSQSKDFIHKNNGSIDDLVYVLYTSGSTGKPKGVMIENNAITNRLIWMQNEYKLTKNDSILQKTPYTFDVSIWEFFWPLIVGSKLVMAKPNGHKDQLYLKETIKKYNITVLHFVPSMLKLFLEDKETIECSSINNVFCSGEILPIALVKQFYQIFPTKNLFNLYGPTEASIDVSYWNCKAFSNFDCIPIGKPISNVSLYICNKYGKQVPVGVAGELYISGICLARGYLNNRDLTDKSFFKINMKKMERIYKTGDIARYLNNGDIEFLGRKDFQVKLNGSRIELGEIESNLNKLKFVNDCAVMVNNQKQLIAFIKNSNFEIIYFEKDVIKDNYSKSLFKLKRPNIRIDNFFSKYPLDRCFQKERKLYFARKSYRNFLPYSIYLNDVESILKFNRNITNSLVLTEKISININEILSSISAYKDDQIILPKYLYPSAGSTYPVQIYVSIYDNDAINEKITNGNFYYNPEDHSLNLIKNHEFQNLLKKKLLTFHLIGRESAIKPIYGSNWKRFALVEAGGILVQLENSCLKNGLKLKYFQSEIDLKNELLFDKQDLIIGSYDILNDVIIDEDDFKIKIFVYIHSNGLFYFNNSNYKLEFCNVKAEYPLYLNYSGENSTIIKNSSFLIFYTGQFTHENYINAGKMAFNTCNKALRKNIGLCYLGLSKIDKSLMPLIDQNELLLCIAGGYVSKKEIESFELTKPKANNSSINEYLINELRNFLPDFMLPSKYVVLNEFPKTMNGKLDSKALLFPENNNTNNWEEDFEEPRNEIEKKLVKLWSELLSLDKISVASSLISLGANSLTITRAHLKIKELFQINVDIAKIFNSQTIKAQAAVLLEKDNLKSTKKYDKPEQQFLSIQNSNQFQLFRASFAQQRMWFLQNVLPKNTHFVYHIPVYYDLKGKLNINALKKSLLILFNRHESLRVSFLNIDSDLYQKVSSDIDFPFEYVYLHEDSENLHKEINKSVIPSFDLSKPPLFRIKLINLNEKHHYLILVFHHIITDGDSIKMFTRELIDLYNRNNFAILPEISHQYTQFSVWQRSLLEKGKLDEQIDFWMEYLKDSSVYIDIPTDFPRKPIFSYNGEIFKFKITKKLKENLHLLCVKFNTTFYVPLFTSFSILLKLVSNQNDFNIGIPVANRQFVDADNIFGNFINTLVIRNKFFSDISIRQVMQDVKNSRLNCLINQDLPFELLIEKLNSLRDPSYHPIFQVMFIMLEKSLNDSEYTFNNIEPIDPLNAMGIDFDLTEFKVSKFDITLRITEVKDEFLCHFEYCSDLFELKTMQNFAKMYMLILDKLCEDIDCLINDIKLPIMNFYQNITDYSLIGTSIIDFFEEQVSSHENDVAISNESIHLSYSQLNKRVDQISSFFLEKNVHQNDLIAINLDASIEFVTIVLALQKIGAAYLPIDPNYPFERLKFILQESKAKMIISNTVIDLDRIEQINMHEMFSQNSKILKEIKKINNKENLAYIIYTSGSTGQPKGVEINCENLWSFINSFLRAIPINRHNKWLSVTKPIFDIFAVEFFIPLISGGHLVIPTRQTITNIPRLIKLLKTATIFQATPTLWKLLIEASWNSDNEEFIGLCGGENMSYALAISFSQMKGRFFNLYGPTEATIWSSFTQIDKKNPQVNIGKPLSNTSFYIMDDYNNQVVIGARGQLYIGGFGVSRSYCDAELNAKNFIKNPFSNPKDPILYKTGDLVRCKADKTIEYLNRIDSQVKLNGYRIELREIENVLSRHPNMQQKSCIAVVLNNEKENNINKLVVFVKFPKCQNHFENELKIYLRNYLPNYMLPDRIFFIDEFPLTNNGKIDYKLLKIPISMEKKLEMMNENEQNKVEIKEIIIKVMKSILNIENIVSSNNFFDIGLNSLMIMRASLRLTELLKIEVSTLDFFVNSSIDSLSIFLTDKLKSQFDFENNVSKNDKRLCSEKNLENKIAIIGMSARFPKSENINIFWHNLKNGVDCVESLDDNDLRNASVSQDLIDNPNYVKEKARLTNLSMFDAEFFNYSCREAQFTNPGHRILIEEIWQSLESAGYTNSEVLKKMGIFVGCGDNDYLNGSFKDEESLVALFGNEKDYLATKIAYKLNIQGPAINIQTACSSSLVAVHLACQSLRSNETDICIAGGVSVAPLENTGYLYKPGLIFSPTGRCKTFDEKADGIIASQGCGIVILKRLEDAINDSDNILAVIAGSAINNDGNKKIGFTAPSFEMQKAVIKEALKMSKTRTLDIGYIETHGTGTSLGDPIEIKGLSSVFKKETKTTKKTCAIGSVKTNIGHTSTASGVAGLIKTVLSLLNKQIPPVLHFKSINPKIDLDRTPFYINKSLKEWLEQRKAGVSSFGIGGTNAHVIIEEAPEIELDVENILKNQWLKMSKQYNHLFDDVECTKFKEYKKTSHLIVLSARNEKALIDLQKKYIEYLKESREENNFEQDMCFTASVGRNHFSEERIAFLFNNLNELENDFDFNLKENNTIDSNNRINGIVKRSTKKNKNSSKVAFLFTGQGSQYARMSYDLFESNLVFRTLIINCDRILSKYLNSPKLVDVLYGCSNEYLNDTEYAQVTLFSLEYCLACLWRSFGIECDIVMGHSIGEYVASVLSGCFSLEDGIKLTYMRGKLMKQTQNGKMIAVLFDLSKIEKLIQQNGNKIDVAGINSQKQIVLSGAQRDIDQFAKLLIENGCTSVRELNTNKAFHSRYMEPILDEFDQYAKTIQFKSDSYKNNSIIWISTLDGLKEKNSNFTLTSKHWTNQIRNKVDFMASVKILIEMNVTCCIEIGPNQILTKLAQQCLNEYQLDNNKDNILWLNTLKPKTNDMFELQFNLAKWYVNGGQVDWMGFHSSYISKRIVIPTYAFQRQSYWIDKKELTKYGENKILSKNNQPLDIHLTQSLKNETYSYHPLLGNFLCVSSSHNEYVFEHTINTNSKQHSYLLDHKIFDKSIYPGACYIEMIYSAAFYIGKMLFNFDDQLDISIEEINFQSALYLMPNQSFILQTIIVPKSNNENNFDFFIYSKKMAVTNFKPNDSIMHSKGNLCISMRNKKDKSFNINLQSIRNRCNQSLDSDQVYESIRNNGINYGPLFRPIKKYFFNNQEACAELSLKSIDLLDFKLDPILLDGGLQAAASFLIGSSLNSEVFIPYNIGNIEVFSNLTTDCFIHVINTDLKTVSSEILKASICFYTLSGKLILIIHNFAIKKLFHQNMVPKVEKDLNFFDEIWMREDTNQFNFEKKSNTLIIFLSSNMHSSSLRKCFKDHFNTVIIELHKILNDFTHLDLFFKKLDKPFICLFFANDTAYYDSTEKNSLDYDLQLLINLCHSLLNNNPEYFGVCTSQNYDIGHKHINLMHSVLNGFCRSLQLEHPEIKIHQIDFDSNLIESGFQRLKEEIFCKNKDAIVAYRDENRYVVRLKQMSIKLDMKLLNFKDDESFLITGGLGGLGFNLTKWLINKGVKNFIILAHRKNFLREKILNEYKNITIKIYFTDISNRFELEKIINLEKERTKIVGIFHLAGILLDKPFRNMKWSDFESVLKPKVYGAINLHELTISLDIRYFVMFSSLTSLVGSPGQVNYSAANGFLNSLIAYRKNNGLAGQCLVWGPWSQVGMASNLVQLNLARGLESYDIEDGLEQMELALRSGLSNLVLVRADWNKISTISKQLKFYLGTLTKNNGKETSKQKHPKFSLEYKELESFLKSIISKYTNSTEYDLGFMEMGIDSLSMVGIRNEIQEYFGDSIELSSTLLFDSNNLKSLTNDLLSNLNNDQVLNNDDDDWTKTSAFLTAAGKGNLDILRVLAESKRTNLNETDSHGRSALYIATMNNQIEIVEYLSKKKVDFNLKNTAGQTALDCAIKKNYHEIEKILKNYL